MTVATATAWRAVALNAMSDAERRRCFSDCRTAAPWIEAAADLGLAEAQLALGRMLLEGEGIARDRIRAFRLFKDAAQSGNLEAENMLGRCHEHGWGTLPNPTLAAIHYGNAAQAGDAWGQYNLGHLLLDGLGVARDVNAAFHWYEAAANQGHVRAMNLVARCCDEGWGTPRDGVAAREWYRRSAKGGYFRAAFNYAAILLADGCFTGALWWFRRALSGATPVTRRNMLRMLAACPVPAIKALAFEPAP